jgi:hypothetical protein
MSSTFLTAAAAAVVAFCKFPWLWCCHEDIWTFAKLKRTLSFMFGSLTRFRRSLCWLMLLTMGHLPVPCFDADWEDRGVAFDSVCDGHAWHTMLLGVVPPSDIDRGPFREDSEDDTESPFGPEFVVTCGSPMPETDCDRATFTLPEMLPAPSMTFVQANDSILLPNRYALRSSCALNITYGVIRV